MKITKLESVTRTYCDECGDECTRSIVHTGGKDYCEKRECRKEWDKMIKTDRVLGRIKEQPFYA